jgi:hypothetical protein
MPQPVPPVPQVPAGWQPAQADFTTWITSPFSYLSQPAAFRAQLTTAQALTGGVFNKLQYNSILEDPYGGWSATATGSQPAYSWLCPAGCAGWYDVTMAGFAASQSGSTEITTTCVFLNGSLWLYASEDWASNGSTVSGTSGNLQVPLIPGDYLEFNYFVNTTTTAAAVTAAYPSVELCWISI